MNQPSIISNSYSDSELFDQAKPYTISGQQFKKSCVRGQGFWFAFLKESPSDNSYYQLRKIPSELSYTAYANHCLKITALMISQSEETATELKLGFCELKCEERLSCTHPCGLPCHWPRWQHNPNCQALKGWLVG